MRSSLLLHTATRVLMPLLLLFSLFLLWRGHNEPGGGFVGGLVAAAAFVLYSLAFGVRGEPPRAAVDPPRCSAWGSGSRCVSGLPGVLLGRPFLSAIWGTIEIGTCGSSCRSARRSCSTSACSWP